MRSFGQVPTDTEKRAGEQTYSHSDFTDENGIAQKIEQPVQQLRETSRSLILKPRSTRSTNIVISNYKEN